MTDYCMKKSEWIKCKDRLPEKSGKYLTVDMDWEFPFMQTLDYSEKWRGWNCIDSTDDENEARIHEMHVTHWMPLPDAPEVEG